jgi:hypothetical protein
MLHDQDLPMFLWVEEFSTVVYLQNMSLNKVSGRMTLEDAFTGKKPKIGHINIFGCLVYFHVLEETRTKLEPTTEKGILVGYNKTSKAYKIYIPALRRTMVRRDVIFEEGKAFRKSCGKMPVDEQFYEHIQEQSDPKEEARKPLQTTGP